MMILNSAESAAGWMDGSGMAMVLSGDTDI